MPALPATGRGPVNLPNPSAVAAALAAGSFLQSQQLQRMPRYLQPVSADPEELIPPNAQPAAQAQAQGPEGGNNLPPEVIGGGLGALRAVLGREAFAAFLRQLAFYTVGPANLLNAGAYAAGFVLDPLRWLYEQGLGLVIPRPPVRPIEGLLTPEATNFLAALTAVFDPDQVESIQRRNSASRRAWIERLLREGRIRPDDPRLLESERRLGIRFDRPGERAAEAERARQLAIALYLSLIIPRLFGEVGESVNVPPAPRGSVDP